MIQGVPFPLLLRDDHDHDLQEWIEWIFHAEILRLPFFCHV